MNHKSTTQLDEIFPKLTLFEGDPDKGAKQISLYNFIKRAFAKRGHYLPAINNYEQLRAERGLLFEKERSEFMNELKLNDVKETAFHLGSLYFLWLNTELPLIQSWLNQKDVSYLIQIEVARYKNYVENEIAKAERTINKLNAEVSKTKEGKTRNPIKIEFKNFKDVFAHPNWEKYISVLEKTAPPLLNKNWEFIGNAKKHKGVICAWVKELQYRGIIKQTVNRSQLAAVLNSEFENFNLGKDGKTLDNISNEFDKKFKNQIADIIK